MRLRSPATVGASTGPGGRVPRGSVGPAAIALFCAAAAGAAQAPAPPLPEPAANDIETSLFLIGDTGHAERPDDPVLLALQRAAGASPARSQILFLGDNVYPAGLPTLGAPGRAAAELRLNTQLNAVRASRAAAIFIPGNHDWARHESQGWDQVRRQAHYVEERGGPLVRFLPEQGCPGPVTVDAGASLRLVLLDTHWWLHSFAKPEHPTSTCPADSEEEVLASLREAVRGAAGRHVFVAGHHPLATGGIHGGYFKPRQHLFPLREIKRYLWIPLPIIGSIYPLARQHGVSDQDLSGKRNRHLRESLESVFRDDPPLVYVAGHDHGLQVLDGRGARHLLVSGAGSYGHTSAVRRRDDIRYGSGEAGYMRVDVLTSGSVRLRVLEVDEKGGARLAFETWLR